MNKYPIIGCVPSNNQSKKVWVVPIDKYKKVDPRDYFITTGEAIVKIDVLLKDLKELTKNICKLKKSLIDAKGDSDYLETCWENNKLLVKKKDKRLRGNKHKV